MTTKFKGKSITSSDEATWVVFLLPHDPEM